MSTNLLVSTFAPFPTLSLAVPSETQFSSILPLLNAKYPALPTADLVLSLHSGLVTENTTVGTLCGEHESLVSLRLSHRLLGGKGGFGSQLRAAGGRMSSQKTSNNDSCRDLNGRRLSTIKEAKKLAEYLESEPERLAAKAEAQKAKLEALERKLGIAPSSGAGSSKATSDSSEPPKLAGTKHRFDDTEYLEQSRELVDGVKSAVSAALLKKKKKAKLSPTPAASESKKETPKAAKKEVAKDTPAATATPTVEAIGA
ncbi:hypothetical protein VKT23_011250 [Stygiomarasmius scandens]|uniref:Sde2 N-terminal ubiquitin domain-containing protein n=1 Tax=Marasmiellus scandens TaxID=2682957 RepID=A0ABR1JDL2_9AGAR